MKKYFISAFLFLLISAFSVKGENNRTSLHRGNWTISYDTKSGKADFLYKDKCVLADVAAVAYTRNKYSSDAYERCEITEDKLNDDFGSGIKYTVVHMGEKKPVMKRIFFLYDNTDYFLTELVLESDVRIASNYMSPISTEKPVDILKKGDNRVLVVPFDNDKWIRYKSSPLNSGINSYEVTALYNPDNREGLVVGSVEHDTWKTGIRVEADSKTRLTRLVCYAGAAGETTRDILPHGKVSGTTVKSPKILCGFFKDLRDGMETFGKACAVVAPPREWSKGVPFGWNSWGKMQFNMTYDKVLEVSDFFATDLQPKGFGNDSILYIGMDSGWNHMTDEQLAEIVKHCKQNGQRAGIYYTPFTDWGRKPDKELEGAPGYTYKDVYLYANGKPQELDGAWAIDPTHPAVQQQIKYFADKFKKAGFEYLKIDFLTHGAMESDSYYDRSVTTGIQAYNKGMSYLESQLEDFYITASISPLFPSQYTHSRRIACDAFGNMSDAEYTLNSVSYGWWLDEVYTFNDPDHLVLEGASEGENRARVTSGVITGIYMSGYDFIKIGSTEAKKKALKFLTNREIKQLARNGRTFRPVNGNDENTDCLFMLRSGKDLYVAAFNYSGYDTTIELPLERLGLNRSEKYPCKELWSGKKTTEKGLFKIKLPRKDAALYRFELE